LKTLIFPDLDHSGVTQIKWTSRVDKKSTGWKPPTIQGLTRHPTTSSENFSFKSVFTYLLTNTEWKKRTQYLAL